MKTAPQKPAVQLPLDALVCHGVWLLLCLVTFLSVMVMNDRFSYTLDDPYIHLAVAEEITKGNYGVNPAEFAAPCSSFIWPFLLAPFVRLPFGDLAPLLLNIAAISLTITVVLRRLRALLPDKDGTSRALARILIVASLLIVSNAIGLAYVGMEHCLQVLVAVVAVDAILAVAAGERIRPWHFAGIIGCPLVRYENFALVAAAVGFLALERRWLAAAACLAAPIVILGAFGAFLVSHGLAPLPTSVLAKGGSGGIVEGAPDRLIASLMNNRGVVIAAVGAALAAIAIVRRPFDSTSRAALCIAGAGLLHMAVGTYGWYNRYEAYIIAALFFGLIGIGLAVAPRIALDSPGRVGAAVLMVAVVTGFPYLHAVSTIPRAANNIYEQQYQMHRFVTENWKRPVAVNDLGWVAYRNDQRVLDLWGLASKEALEARLSNQDTGWMDEMTRNQGVDLAVIYQSWFGPLPDSWLKVGELRLSGPRITPADSAVAFYATDRSNAAEIESLLAGFRPTLPTGVQLLLRSEVVGPTASN